MACVLQNATQDPREAERNNGPHDVCLASLHVTPRPTMIDTQQHPTSSSTMKWKAQKTSARAVPSGERGGQPLSPRSLPGHRRKRRNGLVVVIKHLNTSTKIMCVLRVPVTTPTKATTMQTKSSSAASSFNNLMVSSMKSQCSGPAPAQSRRPAVSRHRQWPSSPPLSRLVTGWCNGTQKN